MQKTQGLTAAEKLKPYAEYFYRPLAPIADDVKRALRSGPIDPRDALAFERKNDLLDPGYHTCESGYCFMPDGSCYAAALTRMPGVSIDMLSWWFWWHALEDLRYKIWYPGAHAAVRVKDPDRLRNPNLSPRERFYHNPHYPVEDIGIGMEMLIIEFMAPEDFGFDASRLAGQGAAAFCTRVGSFVKPAMHTDMCHVVRLTEDGVEMRSRFWIGRNITVKFFPERFFINRLINTRPMRKLFIPGNAPEQMANHCAREYSNLAAILPELYRDYGGVKSQ